MSDKTSDVMCHPDAWEGHGKPKERPDKKVQKES